MAPHRGPARRRHSEQEERPWPSKVQWYKLQALPAITELTVTERAILNAIAARACGEWRDGFGGAYFGAAELASLCGLAEDGRQVKNLLQSLQAKGWLRLVKRGGGRGRANEWAVTAPPHALERLAQFEGRRLRAVKPQNSATGNTESGAPSEPDEWVNSAIQ